MGFWKPLIPFGGRTMVETAVEAALEACGRVILVTGFRGEELAALFPREARVVIARNPDWERGMFSSILAGMERVESDRFFVGLADMPFVRAEAYCALLSAPEADAVFPVHGGERGHPVLLSRRIIGAARAADPVSGRMKDVISGYTTLEIPWPDDSILRDIDTPEDAAALTDHRGAS